MSYLSCTWHVYWSSSSSLSNIKLSQTVWELWPAQDFGFRADNYITKTVRVVSLARDTSTGPPLHSYQISKCLRLSKLWSAQECVYGRTEDWPTDTMLITISPKPICWWIKTLKRVYKYHFSYFFKKTYVAVLNGSALARSLYWVPQHMFSWRSKKNTGTFWWKCYLYWAMWPCPQITFQRMSYGSSRSVTCINGRIFSELILPGTYSTHKTHKKNM